MTDYCDLILDSMTALMDNKLPHSLITRPHLTYILKHATIQLRRNHPTYIRALDKLNFFYKLTNLGYTVVDDRMVINWAIPIKLANQKPFDLYRIELVPVPVNISRIDNAPESYTKLKLDDVSYITFHENNCVELNNVKMEFCDNFGGYYICDDTIVPTHRNQVTCAMAIFWHMDLRTIQKLCNFDFYPKVKVPARILEDRNLITFGKSRSSIFFNL